MQSSLAVSTEASRAVTEPLRVLFREVEQHLWSCFKSIMQPIVWEHKIQPKTSF